ncbi:DNA-binding protein [Streptomyces fumigatiscleroticus]|nr:DNA-binding protein [Streptomyces fumigatiscleroticus]
MADPQSNAATSAYTLPESLALPPDAPRSGVLHVRHRHTERYTVVGNHLAQHPSLSAVAIGLGVHIQSLPDGASVTIKALAVRFPEGEVTIGRALRELEAAGYLVRCRVPLGGGRIATRTVFVERPGMTTAVRGPVRGSARASPPVSASVHEATPVPVASEPPAARPVVPRAKPGAQVPVAEPTGEAADLLVRLRLADARLLLSVRDVHRLVPAVESWLARAATPDQIARTLTAGLPPEGTPIHHPVRFLEHRLGTLLPPPLPPAPREAVPDRPAPMTNCDGCDRGIRAHDPNALCRDCRDLRECAA